MSSSSQPAGAFPCLRVLEVGEGIAVALAGMLFADCCADVIKVEPPSGDRLRGDPGFLVWNRGKRSVALDLTSSRGRDDFRLIAKTADLVLSSILHPETEALELGHDALCAENERLVYCAITGYGDSGPLRDHTADDGLVSAVSGHMAVQAGAGQPPVFLRLPLTSTLTGALAAAVSAAGLYVRERYGIGQRVSVSMLGSTLFGISNTLTCGDRVQSPVPRRNTQQGPFPSYRALRCSDSWLALGVLGYGFWNKLCLALERDDLLVDPRFANAPWVAGDDDGDALTEILMGIFRERPRAYWLDLLDRHGIPVAAVSDVQEFLSDPQVGANDMIVSVADPALGEIAEVAPPVEFEMTPCRIRSSAPTIGEHSTMVLNEAASRVPPSARLPGDAHAGVHTEEQEEMLPRYALEGIRVLDYGSYIAAPSAGRLLAALGAEVIKIEPPAGGDQYRGVLGGFVACNDGKSGVAIDLWAPSGQVILHRAVPGADVFLQNLRSGADRQLGVDYETLRAINPRLVYASVSAYGDRGPDAGKAAFDLILQGKTGMAATQAGTEEDPVILRAPFLDFLGGALLSWGSLAALYVRERRGLGQHLKTSLLGCSLVYQAANAVQYSAKPLVPPLGDSWGDHPLYRIYPTADGYLFLSARHPDHWPALCRALGHPDWLGEDASLCPPAALIEHLIADLRERPTDEWLALLARHRVPAAPLVAREDSLAQAQVVANGLAVGYQTNDLGRVVQVGQPFQLSRTPGRLQHGSPSLGEHTRRFLESLGYSDDDILAFALLGTVKLANEKGRDIIDSSIPAPS